MRTATEMTACVLGVCLDGGDESSGEKGVAGRRRPLPLAGVPRQEPIERHLGRRDTTTTDGSTTTDAATSVTATTTPTDTTATTTDAATTTTTSLVCSTEKETSITSCDATSTYDCSLVATTASVCVDGLYCTTDTAGNHLCMVEQNGLTTSGAIVTIILAVVLATITGTLSTLYIRDRMEGKRRHANVPATANAKDSAAAEPLLEQGAPTSQFGFKPVNTSSDHTQEPSAGRNPVSG